MTKTKTLTSFEDQADNSAAKALQKQHKRLLFTTKKSKQLREIVSSGSTSRATLSLAREALACGADPSATDEHGNDALMTCTGSTYPSSTQTDVTALLIPLCGVTRGNKKSQTALHQLCNALKGNPDIAMLLLAAGADPKARDQLGMDPLMRACRVGNMNLVLTLIDASEVMVQDTAGWTALHWATRSKSFNIVQALISKGWSDSAMDGADLCSKIARDLSSSNEVGANALIAALESSAISASTPLGTHGLKPRL